MRGLECEKTTEASVARQALEGLSTRTYFVAEVWKCLKEKYTELGAEIEAMKELSKKDMEDMFELCTQE